MIARLLVLILLAAQPVFGQDVARIVYLGVADDPLYEPRRLYTGLSLRDVARPVDGARLGLRDTRVLGRALGIAFELEEQIVDAGDLGDAVAALGRDAPLALLIDLPPDAAKSVGALPANTIPIDIRDGSDRSATCVPGMLRTAPSREMLSDALAQYLRARGWDNILLIYGQNAGDQAEANDVRASAAKFGLEIADARAFALTNDPRRRDQSNIALLTGGVRHDVIWLVDGEGEFGRYLPYATYDARPVVGAEGLRPLAWHWTFERYGAPQLNQRFRRLAGRDMTSPDWAAWVAVKAVADAVVEAGSVQNNRVAGILASPDFAVDLYKGVRGGFRPWDSQLRQPILLATHNAVIAVAPVDGFEHRTNTLDTLGAEVGEGDCEG